MLLQAPESASPPPDRANYCLHDNEALARYLVAEFVSNFGAYRGLAALQNLSYRKLNRVEASGDPRSTYTETVSADDLDVQLTWSGLRPIPLRVSARKVRDGEAPHAKSVRRLSERDHNGEWDHAPGQAGPARNRRTHHHHRDAGVLRDLDPRQLILRRSPPFSARPGWCPVEAARSLPMLTSLKNQGVVSSLPFDNHLLDCLMDQAHIDVTLTTSKHNVQYLLGGHRTFSSITWKQWGRAAICQC